MAEFSMGRIVLTSAVYEWTVVKGDFAQFVQSSLRRHARGDWGNLSRKISSRMRLL